MKYSIFISYSRKDKEIVAPYAEFLRSHGYSVWIDLEDLPAGHAFPEEIVNAIKECKILLFFSSTHSNGSKWVKREVVYADQQDKLILPIRLDDSEYHSSLQLLLSGVEHIDTLRKKPNVVMNELLSSLEKEIGLNTDGELCPIVNKKCPKPNSSTDSFVQEKLKSANRIQLFKYQTKCEALVFTALCEAIWLLILGFVLIPPGILSHALSLFVCGAMAFFLSIYTTHLSTSSMIVPGWYNRHLTTYGALILTMDFFVSTACLSISGLFSTRVSIALLFFFESIIGIIGIYLIYRLKKTGYYILWIDVLLFAGSSITLWSVKHRVVGVIGTLIVLSLAMLILTYTLKLRKNGSSTWGLLFGEKTHQADQRPSAIERFLLSIWVRLFH
ncbi:MAG: toll/interleukin-1 receptor domain-containing protein [Prevotella sp.]|nr:toll/interleukin-1 receptor domain-containing protein [Prevotella sp.]